MEILLGKIAYEKAGIIKENGIAVVYKQNEEAKEVIKDVCKEKNAKYIEANFDDIKIKKSNIHSQVFDCTILGTKIRRFRNSINRRSSSKQFCISFNSYQSFKQMKDN